MKGKLNGIALRVNTPNVSVVDLVVNVEKKGLTAEEVNNAFHEALDSPMKGILVPCEELLVVVDFHMSDGSSSVNASLAMVMGDDMVKVVAWYDNERFLIGDGSHLSLLSNNAQRLQDEGFMHRGCVEDAK